MDWLIAFSALMRASNIAVGVYVGSSLFRWNDFASRILPIGPWENLGERKREERGLGIVMILQERRFPPASAAADFGQALREERAQKGSLKPNPGRGPVRPSLKLPNDDFVLNGHGA